MHFLEFISVSSSIDMLEFADCAIADFANVTPVKIHKNGKPIFAKIRTIYPILAQRLSGSSISS
jgi:hypothetical protein